MSGGKGGAGSTAQRVPAAAAQRVPEAEDGGQVERLRAEDGARRQGRPLRVRLGFIISGQFNRLTSQMLLTA